MTSEGSKTSASVLSLSFESASAGASPSSSVLPHLPPKANAIIP
ncbi:hypothetical protein MtrunA17_Chr5g0420871 [Medicago truncatula]|uniref:Uncharacterized protein n=1 Tax=Medicago truncatula TaxID=3880 RepID=A0A396HWC8_MEDTR|nr:hypothetical protein MtrunA17_Chr5g0420871 [Medicago truncatula]